MDNDQFLAIEDICNEFWLDVEGDDGSMSPQPAMSPIPGQHVFPDSMFPRTAFLLPFEEQDPSEP